MDADGDRPGPEVVGFDRTSDGFPELDQLVEITGAALVAEGVTEGRLDLIAVDEVEMAELNLAHMGHEGPTDVLSFPLDDDGGADQLLEQLDGLERHLGDVVLCPSVARRQAPEHCGTEAAELALLSLHGMLHILGHDHAEADESERMMERERHHLHSLGYTHPGPATAPQGSTDQGVQR